MLRKTLVTFGSWIVGVLGVIAIFWYYQPREFSSTLRAIGAGGLAGWFVLTLLARISANEATVRPLAALGFHLTRPDAFWISWVRTFVNQITPLIGVAAYAHMIRRHTGIPWSQVAALGQPQILLAAGAISSVGAVAMLTNYSDFPTTTLGLGTLYLAIAVVTIGFATGAHWLLDALPAAVARRVTDTAEALRCMARTRGLILCLLLFHALAVLLRGARVWFLFAAAGISLDAAELLLVLAVAESSLLLNLTPGALGVREGAILAGAGILSIPAEIAASVALIDRLFMIAITTLLAAPAVTILRRPRHTDIR